MSIFQRLSEFTGDLCDLHGAWKVERPEDDATICPNFCHSTPKLSETLLMPVSTFQRVSDLFCSMCGLQEVWEVSWGGEECHKLHKLR